MKDLRDYSLKAHNTFGIEARCARFLEFETVEEAQQVAGILQASTIPYIIIGGGSNLLLTRDIEGIVVRSGIKGVSIDDDRMTCGSGEVFDEMVERALEAGLYGMENLSLIPGDVGASAVQNIGAYGVEAKDFISTVEAVEIATGKVRMISNQECEYSYRQSRFKHEWKNRFLITRVTYQLSHHFVPHLEYGNLRHTQGATPSVLRQTIIDIRNAKLPDLKVLGNAGSFFMNPIVPRSQFEALMERYPEMPHYEVDPEHVKIPAGWMIEQCGWKGKALGRAGVHDKQALVLVNLGGATGQEIVDLCQTIQRDVKTKFGIEIKPEVNII